MGKNEPLKGKKMVMIGGAKPIPAFSFFFADSIKSAVLGLLEDIEMEKERYKEIKEVVAGLCLAEEKIKKWFPDVFDENERELRI